MDNKRINRISEEVKKVVSDVITNKLKDPRISPMTSVTHVEVTRDLRYAKIYVSVLGEEIEKKSTLEGLENSKGFIRKEIGDRIDLRYVPEPIFHVDDSIEHSIYISKLIEKVNEEDEKKRRGTDE
ncbi:30S ribosome-binding factor RbfA [Sporanaerobacter acetigenes]|uniref:Ribosome-binding factor A n=1 Tax=Sporanaerobacter acetigenes DSM 13106 TaxID=1123281 RepID=A0A1M5XJB8_9FIRM|nr:30S ribosome-binding factor RbfA [Sporanaerobacter acetigenes]SHH99965.1 ribosome-binding factor A [Sporanaerobacter acetigenes DSM 13106]